MLKLGLLLQVNLLFDFGQEYRLPGFVAATGIAWSGFPENHFTSGGPYLLSH